MDGLLTTGEVARALNVPPRQVVNLASVGKLRPAAFTRGRRLYRIEDVRAALAGYAAPAPGELVTAAQAALAIGRKVGTVRSWVCTGKLVCQEWRRGVGLFRLADVRAVAARVEASPQGKARGRREEPTAEEVERLVSEGYAKLPRWWHSQVEREWKPGGRA